MASQYISYPSTGNTFASGVTTDSVTSNTAVTMTHTSNVADGASAVGFTFNTTNSLATSGAKLFSFQNGGSEKVFIDKSGNICSGTDNTGSLGSGSNRFNGLNIGGTATIGGNISLSGNLNGPSSATVNYNSQVTNGSTAIAHTFNTTNALSTAGAKIGSFQNHNTEKIAVDLAGKFVLPTGGADAVVGVATMAAGAVTVSTTSVTASSKIYLSHAGATITNAGTLYVGTITAGTSFQIKSTNASDTDTVNWWIVN